MNEHIATILGTPVTVEINSTGIDPAHLNQLFFAPLERALLDICRDPEERTRLATTLTRVQIQNSGTIATSRTWCTFSDGTLTLDHSMTELDDVEERAQRLVRVLERALR